VALETLWLARGSEGFSAMANIALQLFLGMFAVWIGNLLAHQIAG
jgi:fluoride ion exporter CrcB/FEX